MAFGLVQAANNDGNGSATGPVAVTFAGAPTNGNLLVAYVAIGSALTAPVAQGTWQALDLVHNEAGGQSYAGLFYKIAGAGESAAQTVCTLPDGAGPWAVGAQEYSAAAGIGVQGQSSIEDNDEPKATASFSPPQGVVGIIVAGAYDATDTGTFSAHDCPGANSSGLNVEHAKVSDNVAGLLLIELSVWDETFTSFSGSYSASCNASGNTTGGISAAAFFEMPPRNLGPMRRSRPADLRPVARFGI